MNNNAIKLQHLNATPTDLAGNNGIGRYVLLPGSDGRAQKIAANFEGLRVNEHPRGHHLYLGHLNVNQTKIEVATIASGMGCPSMEIILHELFNLGAKRFLRVGTSGSLQPQHIELGDFINVQASVRDEQTTTDYMPREIPAIASLDMLKAIHQAATTLNFARRLHTGIVHCKSSLYAREFGQGPQRLVNENYMQLLTDCGVLASEMETSTLFIQSQYYNHLLQLQNRSAQHRVITGALLEIIAIPPDRFASGAQIAATTNDLIELALNSIVQLAQDELR